MLRPLAESLFAVSLLAVNFWAVVPSAACCADEVVSSRSPKWAADWKVSGRGGVAEWFDFSGTGARNNPLRRQIDPAFDGDEVFVRFQLRYDGKSIDTVEDGNGEFFVFWLDETDGGDTATHATNVPNVGIHVNGKRNQFMARFSSASQHFSGVDLEGDRIYSIIVRLARNASGSDYGRLSVWIDPSVTELESPVISIASAKSIGTVRWIGFSTGAKTEASDRIAVSEIEVASTWLEVLGLSIVETASESVVPEAIEQTEQTVSFSNEVEPVLRQACFKCHSGKSPDSGLRLDSYDELLNQVVPRDASTSRLVELIRSDDPDVQMPPPDHQRLSVKDVKAIAKWVDEGVSWDHELLPTPTPKTNHWSFQPLRQVVVPQVADSDRARTSIDSFIVDRQNEIGVRSVGRADWSTLQRRIALDLTGLPPSEFPGIEDATTDEQIDAWIERLLQSQAYGERWGRFWLDLARWAESNGHQHNRLRPHAWRYRDYVIRSFQNNTSYDRFVREQLAGDFSPETPHSLEATGFLAAARYSGNELDKEIQRNDILVDVVNTTSKSLMGLTLECAQCHTHKFDPITIRDYYRFQAFFTNGQPGNVLTSDVSETARSWVDLRWQLFDSVEDRLVAKRREAGHPEPILVIPKSVVSGMTAKERRVFSDLEAAIAQLPQTWAWAEATSGLKIAPHEMRWPLTRDRSAVARLKTYVRLRGDVKARGPRVQPGWPSVFGQTSETVTNRSDLADWLTSPDHPLVARVWVNRMWQWHFGVGLVKTSDDFGTQGTLPADQDLLDWLARELIDSGWDNRHIHRLILRSATYRQSTEVSESSLARDPANETLWRWQPRRLESEAIRDSVLSVAGELDRAFGGPSVDETSHRRSIYLRQQRERIPESLTLFDSPAALVTCSRRRVSTVPLQPLYLLNSEFMQQMSRSLARRVESSGSEKGYAAMLVKLTLGRDATEEEVGRMNEYLRDHSLESLCLVMLNLNEFLYLN